MKILKHIALGLFLATSTIGVSSVSMAVTLDEDGRAVFSPAEAIDNVVVKIKEAEAAIAEKKDGKAIAKIIQKAKSLGKEINANDKVDVLRQRATSNLTKAKSLAKKGKLEESKELLEEAIKKFGDLKAHI
ncbi:MAG: hypothetical protein KAG10_08495 [Methylococcales bacterium]|nr:hypothetical protein [Methylococcales bacterium]MCK5925916.1 hypothetical protein [Methylococcales bacterium]